MTMLCMTLLCVDAITWAYQYGLKGALPWVATMIGVYFWQRWKIKADARIPMRRMRQL